MEYCPECLKRGEKIEGALVSCAIPAVQSVPYWDENGNVHYSHAPANPLWVCKYGHKWVTKYD
jgi:hypothetical protein